jgi:hypothetical protein
MGVETGLLAVLIAEPDWIEPIEPTKQTWQSILVT